MLLLGIRGGRELAEKLNWAQFTLEKDEKGEQTHWVFNPNEHGENQRSGGIRTFRIKRELVNIEFCNSMQPHFNQGLSTFEVCRGSITRIYRSVKTEAVFYETSK